MGQRNERDGKIVQMEIEEVNKTLNLPFPLTGRESERSEEETDCFNEEWLSLSCSPRGVYPRQLFSSCPNSDDDNTEFETCGGKQPLEIVELREKKYRGEIMELRKNCIKLVLEQKKMEKKYQSEMEVWKRAMEKPITAAKFKHKRQ